MSVPLVRARQPPAPGCPAHHPTLRRPEIRGQKSEIRGQWSEVGSQRRKLRVARAAGMIGRVVPTNTAKLTRQGAMKSKLRGWLASFLLLVAGPAACAGDADWKVGLAQVKITPSQPMLMSGYAGRTKPFESVAGELYVKAMVLQDSTGRRAALVTSDLIGFPAAVAEPICERLEQKIGLKREAILLNSAHTHAGPQLGVKPPAKDAPDAGEALRSLEYTRDLQDKVVAVVVEAMQRLQSARLLWGSGVIHFSMNRREFTPGGVILGVNPRGLADRSVPVLRVDSPEGAPRAILFGAAVHGTTLGQDNLQLCGDFAGFAQGYV